MVIMQDALPGIKRFLKAAGLSQAAEQHVSGFMVAFIMHLGACPRLLSTRNRRLGILCSEKAVRGRC